jgi:DNA-binding transcriptional ArsR family regulator
MAIDVELLRAIASPRRVAILGLIWDRERTAGEIAAGFDVSWPAISQNLATLRRVGAITERRDGTRRFYRADQTALAPLMTVIRSMWASDLETLRLLAEAEQREERP